MEFLVPFVSHKNFLIATAPLLFLMVLDKIFYTNDLMYKGLKFQKNLARHYLLFEVMFVFKKRQLSQSLHFSCDQLALDAHGIERLINSQVHFDYIKVLFYNREIN